MDFSEQVKKKTGVCSTVMWSVNVQQTIKAPYKCSLLSFRTVLKSTSCQSLSHGKLGLLQALLERSIHFKNLFYPNSFV